MKTVITFLLLLVTVSSFAQAILRANNTPTIAGANIYTTIQAAHDAAADGDFIYVEPSATNYGDLVCSKQLTFVGTGYYLSENGIYPVTSSLQSIIGYVTFKTGSQNSIITGLSIAGIAIQRVSNITITRNLFYNPASIPPFINIDCFESPSSYTSISNIIITNNVQSPSVNLITRVNGPTNYTITSVLIKNNLIDELNFGSAAAGQLTASTIVMNNIINKLVYVQNTTLKNNIIVNTNNPLPGFGFFTFTNSDVTNNVSFGANLPVGSGNQNSIADPFVGLTGNSPDTQFRLKPGAAGEGAGTDGTDCGIFGGDTPYILSGIPAYPTIPALNVSGTGSETTPLSVTISTRSNN